MEKESLWDRLASVSLAELWAMRRRLDAEYERRQAELDGLEERKSELDQRGAAERGLRRQQALARQLNSLDRRAALEASLLRLVGKQQRLLDRFIWVRESEKRWEALRAAAPAAVELDWSDLVYATENLVGLEGKLDGLLRILGVPEEEWPQAAGPPPVPEAELVAKGAPEGHVYVAEVLDGQTVRLATGERVRYIGVDAPLLQGSLGDPDPGSHEAWEANRRLVEGQYVRLEVDAEDRDADGVLWRYVWLDKVCASAELIRRGYAYHQPRSPNYRYLDWFARLEAQARRKKRGVWK